MNNLNWLKLIEERQWLNKFIIEQNQKSFDGLTDNAIEQQSLSGLHMDRHILRLIFCSQCLNNPVLNGTTDTVKADDFEFVEFKIALSYVLRETVRFLGFKETPFCGQPVLFAEKLSIMTNYHAEKVQHVRLPANLSKRMLNALKATNRRKQRIALEHIQHVTDIYIAGFVLGEINLPDDINTNLFDFLSVPAEQFDSKSKSAVSSENLRKSFALAALFHDMAMFDEDDSVGDNQQALAILLQHSVLNELEQDKMSTWLNEVNEHALFSAANLVLRVEEQNNRYSLDDDPIGTTDINHVTKPATLAVLHHTMPQVRCNRGKYNAPTTTLLGILDELFEWEPSSDLEPEIYRTVDLSPNFNLGTPPKSTQPVKQHVTLSGISVELDESSGHLQLAIAATKNGAEQQSSQNDVQHICLSAKPFYPVFNVFLATTSSLLHRVIPTILKLAQTFGRIQLTKNDEQSAKQNEPLFWQPRVVVHLEYSPQLVIRQIHHIALKMGNEVSPLLHKLCDSFCCHNNMLTLGSAVQPFANIDIRDHLGEINKILSDQSMMLDQYGDN